ncbi:hypothetical protein FA15DRAFT_692301 [Coprinopsis marcescibilis]|uniref:Uncharacterized protein n=1 Tax=Coprinopsis marcescibilis TaxID=230819 RepID=A0A5C3L4H3_COPMA|nr:hypothetical protein FA15DRAFT_692301 [Coprinopsis marcescibilis]
MSLPPVILTDDADDVLWQRVALRRVLMGLYFSIRFSRTWKLVVACPKRPPLPHILWAHSWLCAPNMHAIASNSRLIPQRRKARKVKFSMKWVTLLTPSDTHKAALTPGSVCDTRMNSQSRTRDFPKGNGEKETEMVTTHWSHWQRFQTTSANNRRPSATRNLAWVAALRSERRRRKAGLGFENVAVSVGALRLPFLDMSQDYASWPDRTSWGLKGGPPQNSGLTKGITSSYRQSFSTTVAESPRPRISSDSLPWLELPVLI